MHTAYTLPYGELSIWGCLCPGGSLTSESLSRGAPSGKPPGQRPHWKQHGTRDRDRDPPARNMGPVAETLSNEHGIRQPDKKWHHTETPSPCEHNDRHTGVKTLPSNNFICRWHNEVSVSHSVHGGVSAPRRCLCSQGVPCPPLLLTSRGSHCSGRYASCWNALKSSI